MVVLVMDSRTRRNEKSELTTPQSSSALETPTRLCLSSSCKNYPTQITLIHSSIFFLPPPSPVRVYSRSILSIISKLLRT